MNTEIRYWWVNHKQTYAQETGGGYIWSPTHKKNGQKNQFYENMKLVQPGDLIFSYANTVVKDVGVATGSAALLPKPSNFGKAGDAWANQGWMVPVKFISLRRAFHPKSHMSAISTSLPAKYSPINADGDGNQVAYLASIPDAMFKAVTAAMAGDWGDIHPKLQSVIAGLNTPLSDEDDEVAGAIQNRTDIGETERTQLVKARRGQGIYRKNLEGDLPDFFGPLIPGKRLLAGWLNNRTS